MKQKTRKKNNMQTTIEEKEKVTADEAELRELGFCAAADKMKKDRETARKLRIAFEHFRVVTPEHVNRFNKELMAKKSGYDLYGGYTYQRLAFTPVEIYKGVPPREVLQKMKEAKELGCFDRFEVATLESVTVVPDPVLFGVIDGCDNRYFVAQWDDDVKIEQILREDEG
jgi:hypothetical protein